MSASPFFAGPKARIYAATGCPVYWILDLAGEALVEHTGPTPDGYALERILRSHDRVELPTLGTQLSVREALALE